MPLSRTTFCVSPILLFVKAPATGRVKSRLAASSGSETARELYRCFVLDILDALAEKGHEVIVFHEPPDARDEVAEWLGSCLRYRPQLGADLGERMENAFRSAFSSGATQAILIGSDFPDLPAGILTEATGALKCNDAVIGPALDGGYYMIGFRREGFRPEAFRNITWSTNAVYAETMQALSRAGAKVHRLPQWRDVDTIEDLRALYARNQGTAFERTRTMKAIRSSSLFSKPA